MNGDELLGVTNYMLAAAHNRGADREQTDDDNTDDKALDTILRSPDLLAEAVYEGYGYKYTNAALGEALRAFLNGDTDKLTDLICECVAWYTEESAVLAEEFEQRARRG